MTINFVDRKNKRNSNQTSLKERWDAVDKDAAARGAAISMNGSADFGNLNCSFTAEKDVEEFKKQASVHEELFNKLNNDAKTRRVAAEIDEMLEEMDDIELTEDDIRIFDEEC